MKRILGLFLTAMMIICSAACVNAGDVSAAAADETSVCGTYTYEESLPFGTVPWALTLNEDDTYTLSVTKPTGTSFTYTGTYTADGTKVTTGTPAESTADIEAGFFNDDYSCEWEVSSDGTMKPANGGGGMSGEMPGGMMGGGMMGGGFDFDADYENIPYASNSSAQVMNIYLPDSADGSDPVIVAVHGGGFKFGDQTMEIIEPIVKAGMEHGYVVASVDYRKSGEAAFPGALSDVKAAVRYLRANADEYGIDPEKIVIWGESAGAYLADMTALTPDVAELDADVTDNADVSSAVSAVVSFYAPVEFYTMDEEFIALGDSASANHSQNSFETDYLGIPDMTADKEGVYKNWWGTYQDSVPTNLYAWIQAGTADTNVPYTQSENLASGLTEILGADHVSFGLIEGAAHEDAQFYTDENLSAIFDFLSEVLK